MNMDGRPSRAWENSEAAATPWVGSALLRLLFAGVAGLAAYLYAQQRRRDLGGGGGDGGGDEQVGEDGLAWTCAACLALGAMLVVIMQAELLPPAWPCPWRWPAVQDENVDEGGGLTRQQFHPGDTFESWMFECVPQPSPAPPVAVDVSRKASAAQAAQRAPSSGSATTTRPVLVRLEGRTLSVWSSGHVDATGAGSTTPHNGPRVPRVALWSEPEASLRRARASLTYRRRYHLQGGTVALRPDGLARHRQWSRKYPICITASLEDGLFEPPEDVAEAEKEAKERAVVVEAAQAVVVEEEEGEAILAKAPSLLEVQPSVSALAPVAVVASSVALGQAPPQVLDASPDQPDQPDQPDTLQPSPQPSRPSPSSQSTVTTSTSPAAPTDADQGSVPEVEGRIAFAVALDAATAQEPTSDESDLSDESLDIEEVEERLLGRIVSQELIALTEDDDVEAPVTPTIGISLRATASSTTTSTLQLLARTARQKEEWFWRLRRAVGEDHPLDDDALFEDYVDILRHYLNDVGDAAASDERRCGDPDTFRGYRGYRGLNALASRVLFSVCRSARWAGLVRAHLQRRLAAVRVPAIVERPIVADFYCRPSAVKVDRAAAPRLDAQGLWLDLGVCYRGVTRMVLTTRLNLVQQQQQPQQPSPKSPNGVEDELDHPDEEGLRLEPLGAAPEAASQQHRGSWKIFRKLTESRFFQAALAALSNTDIVLTVELQALDGVLVLHVPPPPSDRVWLGFRGVPCLRLVVVPRVGNRTLRQALLCRLIERKLRAQLEKALVLPNMSNVAVPFMGMSMGSPASPTTQL